MVSRIRRITNNRQVVNCNLFHLQGPSGRAAHPWLGGHIAGLNNGSSPGSYSGHCRFDSCPRYSEGNNHGE